MADVLNDQQAAMAEQAPGSSPGEKGERKSPIKASFQRAIDVCNGKAQAWRDDATATDGERELALNVIAAIVADLTVLRDEEREYGATGRWYGMVAKDGSRAAVQCSATPTPAAHPSTVRCFGGFAGKLAAEVWTRHGKTLPFMTEVFNVAK